METGDIVTWTRFLQTEQIPAVPSLDNASLWLLTVRTKDVPSAEDGVLGGPFNLSILNDDRRERLFDQWQRYMLAFLGNDSTDYLPPLLRPKPNVPMGAFRRGSIPSPTTHRAENAHKVSNFSSASIEYFVKGDVNGTPVEALPDSGADMCFISPKLASGLGLGPASGTQKRLWGCLDGHLTAALPDTGSDVMLVSSAYARKIGLTIDRDFENWLELEFADGTTDWTSGIVRDVSWKVGGKTVRCDFYVLDDLYVDVIPSNSYLFDLNVFSENDEYFFDANSEENLFQLCNIRLIDRYVASPNAFGPEMVQRELARRDQIRDEILDLPENEKEAASQAEARRQRRWEDLRQVYQTRRRTETHGNRTRASEDTPSEEVARGDLRGASTRKVLWKKKASMLSIPLRSLRRSMSPWSYLERRMYL